MEMKINFNKLFHFDDSHSQTPSTTSLQNSYHIDQPSIISSPSNNINLHYKFNDAIFLDNSLTQQKDQIDILQDLSSIGRSYQNSIQKEHQKSPSKKIKATYNKPSHQQSQFFVNRNYSNDNSHKIPGLRLYYQHKANAQKKQSQLQRLKQQKQEQQMKQITFKPAINQNSKKILQNAQSPMRKLQNMKKSNKKKQEQTQTVKSYALRKQQEQLRNCTFHPAINSNNEPFSSSKKTFISTAGERSDKGKVFDQLYNDHRLKQMRKKMAQQQQLDQLKNGKKMNKQQLQQFIQRHNEYIQKRQQKQQILKAVSSQYDLSSGRKLFQPKVKQLPHNYSTALFTSSSTKNINTPSPKVKIQSQFLNSESPLSNKKKKKNLLKSDFAHNNHQNLKSRKSIKIDNQVNNVKKNQQKGLYNTKQHQKKGDDIHRSLRSYQITKIQDKNNEIENENQNLSKEFNLNQDRFNSIKLMNRNDGPVLNRQMQQQTQDQQMHLNFQIPKSSLFSKFKIKQQQQQANQLEHNYNETIEQDKDFYKDHYLSDLPNKLQYGGNISRRPQQQKLQSNKYFQQDDYDSKRVEQIKMHNPYQQSDEQIQQLAQQTQVQNHLQYKQQHDSYNYDQDYKEQIRQKDNQIHLQQTTQDQHEQQKQQIFNNYSHQKKTDDYMLTNITRNFEQNHLPNNYQKFSIPPYLAQTIGQSPYKQLSNENESHCQKIHHQQQPIQNQNIHKIENQLTNLNLEHDFPQLQDKKPNNHSQNGNSIGYSTAPPQQSSVPQQHLTTQQFYQKRNKEYVSVQKDQSQLISPPKKTVNIASLLRANKKKKP